MSLVVVVDTDVASTLLRRRASDTLARQLAGHTVPGRARPLVD